MQDTCGHQRIEAENSGWSLRAIQKKVNGSGAVFKGGVAVDDILRFNGRFDGVVSGPDAIIEFNNDWVGGAKRPGKDGDLFVSQR